MKYNYLRTKLRIKNLFEYISANDIIFKYVCSLTL